MARSKKNADVGAADGDTTYSAFSDFLDTKIKTEFGESTNELRTVLPTGIDLLDVILGGGVGSKFIQFVGQSGGGKTALVSKILATAQKIHGEKLLALYADSEESMSKERLKQLGVNNPPIEPKTEITIEKLFAMIEGLCAFKERNGLADIPSVVIWDSIANTPTETMMDTDDPNSVLGQKARFLSTMLPKFISRINKYNIIFLAVNQMRDNIQIGPMRQAADLRYLSSSKKIPGGQSIIYNSFQLLYVTHSKDVDEYGFNGARVTIKTIKNKLFTPNITATLILDFVNGFSNFWTNYEMLKEHKRVVSGAWSYLSELPTEKFRQKEAETLYNNNAEFKKVFDRNVNEVLEEIRVEYSNIASENTPDDETVADGKSVLETRSDEQEDPFAVSDNYLEEMQDLSS